MNERSLYSVDGPRALLSRADLQLQVLLLDPCGLKLLLSREMLVIFAYLAAFLHVLFFIMESFMIGSSKRVQTIFGFRKGEVTDRIKLLMFNQGCYNLLLAASTLYGLQTAQLEVVRVTLYIYIGAALALLVSSPKMIRGVILQGLPPLVALIF